MGFNLSISYLTEEDSIEIRFQSDENTDHQDKITIPRDCYMGFLSALILTGKKMQSDQIDIGLKLDDNGGDIDE